MFPSSMIPKRHSKIVINAKTTEAGVSIKVTDKIDFVAKAWEDKYFKQ